MDDERTLSHENESAAEDVDPEPKKYVTESTSRQESALDEKRDDDYPEADGESSTSQEECFMEQLPVEILRMIFSYLGSWELYNPRLVSKTWCNILSQDQTLCFNTTVPPHAHLEKCGFKRMSLDFGDIDLSEFPLSIWKKIGCEIHSLTLHGCKIGDQCLKNIIVHCCNLKFLWVNFDNDDSADSFCSPDMLRELHITRKNLETFQIFNIHRRTIDITEWIQKFEDFLKINLKTLSLCLSYWNTNLGITGRPGDAPGVCKIRTAYYHLNEGRSLFSNSSNTISGYSINRLKNLEKLTITGFINSMMNDTIFHEFNFPKLRFLKIEPPDVPKEILNLTMGQNMPALEKIHFTRINYYSDFIRNKELYYENFEGSLASFCQPMKKLHGIIHPGTLTTESGTLKSETIDVFQACQSLRFIEGGDGSSAYRDPYNYERMKYSQKN